MVIEIEIGGVKSIQKQYATIVGKYALLFIITYQDDSGLKKLEQILHTIAKKLGECSCPDFAITIGWLRGGFKKLKNQRRSFPMK